MKSEVTPSVGMLLWWSVWRAGKLYTIITSSVREKHPAMLTIQSALWQRDCEWLHHFLPSSLVRPESQHGCRKDHRMWQIHLQFHLIKVTFVSSHVRLTQKKDHVAQGIGRNTRIFPTEGLAWHKKPQAASLPHLPRDAAIAQQISSQKGFHSCVLFIQYFRRGKTAFYHIFFTLILLHTEAEVWHFH